VLESNKKIVEQLLQELSAGDVENVLELLHEDVAWWISGQIEGISGTFSRLEMGELLRGIGPVFKEGAVKLTPTSMIAEGKRVAVEAESRGELNNGRHYKNLYHFLFEIEDGKIKLVKEYMDTMHVFQTFIE
jgi:ketosteroid isomerase-like protein